MKKTIYLFANGTLGTTALIAIEAIHQSGIADISTNPKLLTLEEACAAFNASLGKSLKSDYAQQLQAAGEALATPYNGLRFAIKGMICSLDPEINALGVKMQKRVADFAKGANLRLPKKKAAYIRSLCKEFEKPEYAAATTIQPYLADMEKVFENYKLLFITRRTDLRKRKSTLSPSNLRKPLIEALKTMVKYVEAMSISTDKPEWDNLYAQLTDCIDAAAVTGSHAKADTLANEPAAPPAA